MTSEAKTTKTLGQVELAKKTLVEWDGRGMELNGVIVMEFKFWIHVITQKIYSSSQLNSVSYEVVDLRLKVVKNSLSFNLVELQHNQLIKNMESIRVLKTNPCNFGSLLTCQFFYVQKLFPSKGTIVRKKDMHVVYQINEFIAEMGDNFEGIMDAYFETLKKRM